jgi:threonine aldolase
MTSARSNNASRSGPIDLRSDTATRPTKPMRRAIAEAEVGDEQLGEDPTVRALEERVAELLGKEAAVFLPSGTLANVIAIFVYCGPGDEVILHRLSHPVYSENAGPAVHTRVSLKQLEGPDGTFNGRDVTDAVQQPGHQRSRTRLVAAEDTNNRAGGAVWPVELLDEITVTSRELGLATHLDGARLVNASVASGLSCSRIAAGFDSAWIDLSKSLGCPVGAVLAGTDGFIKEARWAKHLFGGGLRQAGILAAAGLYALDHHVDRLAEDHRRARALAEWLLEIPGVELAQTRVDTNIIQFDIGASGAEPDAVLARAAEVGVRFGHIRDSVLRAVTHLDVSDEDVANAAAVLKHVLDGAKRGSRPSAAAARAQDS